MSIKNLVFASLAFASRKWLFALSNWQVHEGHRQKLRQDRTAKIYEKQN